MTRKRIFSDRRAGKEVFWGGKRRSLSFPELEERERRKKRPKRPSRVKKIIPAPVRQRAGRVKSVHVALGLVGLLAVFLLVWFFFFVYPSPIGGLSPAPNSVVKSAKADVGARIKRETKQGQVVLEVDGKDVTVQSALSKDAIACKLDLPDGEHKAKLTLTGGGLMGSRSAAWSFTVDTAPPKLEITKKSVTPVKGTPDIDAKFEGVTEKGAVVKVGDRRLPLDKNGGFKGEATLTRAKSLRIDSTDKAGNTASAFIVTQEPTAARGAHVSIYMASGDIDMAKYIGLVERTELNSLEIDLKDESGQIGFDLDYPLAKQDGATHDYIDLDGIVDTMRYKNVYAICRIVVFKDPILGEARPDLVVQSKGGGPWGKGVWMDPYSKEVWDYNIAVAEAAAKAGFNEIQFDYMRFPSDGNTADCVYPHNDGRTPGQVINGFIDYARERLAPYNVFISADLFGLTASKQGEMGIGQKVGEIAKRVDFISPMVYPSHYNPGEYNIKNPESNPGDTVTKSLEDFKKTIAGTQAKLRPWLQDFSLRVTYTPDMVRRQIDATEQAGIHEWLLWDPDCTYSESALKPEAQQKSK